MWVVEYLIFKSDCEYVDENMKKNEMLKKEYYFLKDHINFLYIFLKDMKHLQLQQHKK